LVCLDLALGSVKLIESAMGVFGWSTELQTEIELWIYTISNRTQNFDFQSNQQKKDQNSKLTNLYRKIRSTHLAKNQNKEQESDLHLTIQ